MIHFQYYTGGIKSVVPKGIICINRFFDGVKNTKPEMLEMLNKISHASRIGDIDTKNYLKTKLIFLPQLLYAIIVIMKRLLTSQELHLWILIN
jgi:hypothetical protein